MLPVLHVGFPKTGTTTLQKGVFARHSQIANLGEPDEETQALEAIRAVWLSCDRNLTKRRPLALNEARELWRSALNTCAAGLVPVFSKETLALPDFYEEPGDRTLPRALRELVGEARIIIVIRQQISMIESLYLFQAKGARYRPLSVWLDEQQDKLNMLDFDAFSRSYAEVFGKANVRIFMYEHLQQEPRAFAHDIASFIGVDSEEASELISSERHNVRTSRRSYLYSKLRKQLGLYVPLGTVLPRWMKSSFDAFISAGPRAQIQIPRPLLDRLNAKYGACNARLMEEWNLPLQEYGYPLA